MANKPKTITLREHRKIVFELQDEVTAAQIRANELANEVSGLRQQITAARHDYHQATIQLAHKEGYIDRVREIERGLSPPLAKEPERGQAIDQLRDYITGCPEPEALRILDVLSGPLKDKIMCRPDGPEGQEGYSLDIQLPCSSASTPDPLDWTKT